MKKINFSAGPSILPESVFEQATKSIIDFKGTGLSILETSHRSKEVEESLNKTIMYVNQLYSVPADYSVIFMTGGASSQFFTVPMNLLNEDESAGYLKTGTWASNAIKEAKLFGNINVVASSEEKNYSYIPKNYEIQENLKYLHLTSNNTIFGTQIFNWPETNVKYVCDMSSDIFSRNIDINKFDLIYAGAQKNIGPAGVTLVIIKNDILGKVKRPLPTMLDYRTYIKNNSLYNTPPVFPLYVCMLTLEWLIELGGINEIEKRNNEKAALLYSEIDRNELFYGHAVKEDRSKMNVTFRLHNEAFEKEFLDLCELNGLVGLKGHRSVGGFRASIYNAMEISGIQILVDIMKEFENKKA